MLVIYPSVIANFISSQKALFRTEGCGHTQPSMFENSALKFKYDH